MKLNYKNWQLILFFFLLLFPWGMNEKTDARHTMCMSVFSFIPQRNEKKKKKKNNQFLTQKVAGYYFIPSEIFEILSVCPSVRQRFVSGLFKLCMDIDIGEEWFGIANGLNSFIYNRGMAIDWCKNVFFLNIFRTNGWILIKFCICINTRSMLCLMLVIFREFSTELWPLINVRILFMLNILWISLWISIKFCICIDIDKM